MNALHSRIIEISKKHGLSHIGSACTAAPIIDEIYQIKKEDEPFILSCGHAGLALYCILEKYHGKDAEALYLKHGTHPNRDLEDKIYCSTGSLGMGIGIACGMAMADKSKLVYCLISDGEMFEGVVYEIANVVRKYEIQNLKIALNYNMFGAYDAINIEQVRRVKNLFPKENLQIFVTDVRDYGFEGNEAHYVKL